MTYLTTNLRYLRHKHDYSQKEVANRMFLTHQTISNHETGKSQPPLDVIQQYAKMYDISIKDLIHTDLRQGKRKHRIVFDSILFDLRDKVFIIFNGSRGTYDYTQVIQCEIVYEKARYIGKEPPFTHPYITGVNMMIQGNILEPSFCVALKITMKDRQVLAVYVSGIPTRTQTDQHIKDYNEARKIKKKFDQIIEKYQRKKILF